MISEAKLLEALKRRWSMALPADILSTDLERFVVGNRRALLDDVREVMPDQRMELAAALIALEREGASVKGFTGESALKLLSAWLEGQRDNMQPEAWSALDNTLHALAHYWHSGRLAGEAVLLLRDMPADDMARMLAAVARHDERHVIGSLGPALRDFLVAFTGHRQPDPDNLDDYFVFSRGTPFAHKGHWTLLIEPEVRALARLHVGPETFDVAMADPMPGSDLVGDMARAAADQLGGEYVGRPSQVRELGGAESELNLEDERSKRRWRHVRAIDAEKMRARAREIREAEKAEDVPPPVGKAETIARKNTSDGKQVLLWSDGDLTWALGYAIKGSMNPKTPEQRAKALRIGHLVLGDVELHAAEEIPDLVAAARWAVDHDGLPGTMRARFAEQRRKSMRLKPAWTVISTDRDGKPTERVWELPRLHPWHGYAIWDFGSSRPRYRLYARMTQARRAGLTGRAGEGRWSDTYEPTGTDFNTLDALLDWMDANPPKIGEVVTTPVVATIDSVAAERSLVELLAERLPEAEAQSLLPWQDYPYTATKPLTRDEHMLAEAWAFALRKSPLDEDDTAIKYILADEVERATYPSSGMMWINKRDETNLAASEAGWDVHPRLLAGAEHRLTQRDPRLGPGETAKPWPQLVSMLKALRVAAQKQRTAKRRKGASA